MRYEVLAESKVEAYNFNATSHAYLARLLELGAVEGAMGEMKLAPNVATLIDALHHVLAGGEVAVSVVQPGNAAVVADLSRQLVAGTDEANKANEKAGFYVEAVP